MAYNRTFLKRPKSPIPRVNDPRELERQRPVSQCSDRDLEKINRELNPRNDLGILMGEGGKVPESDGVPRIFLMGLDSTGRDRRLTLEENGIAFGSREFWQEAQMGNVFALPAGERTPVQLTVTLPERGDPQVIARPLGTDQGIPDLPRKKPNLWQRFAHMLNSSWYAAAFNAWTGQERDAESNKEMLASLFEKRKNSAPKELEEIRQLDEEEELEKQDRFQEEQREREEKRKRVEEARRKSNVEEIHRRANSKESGLNKYRDLVAPTPVFHPEHERKTENGKVVKQGFYSRECFNKLDKLPHSYSEFQVGGKTVTQDEYCGLVASCSISPDYAEAGFRNSSEYDPTLKQTLLNAGFSQERSKEIIAHSYMTMPTIDLMKTKLRNNQDEMLETNVNPGRKDAMEALRKYGEGQKDDLAKAIAYGVKHTAATIGNKTTSLSENYLNLYRVSGAAAGLLDRDPELMDLALKKYGMKEDDLKAVKGLAALDKADTARRAAWEKLARAEEQNIPLTEQEKKNCARDIIKANIMEAAVLESNKSRRSKQEDPDVVEAERLLRESQKNGLELTAEMQQKFLAHPEQRPLPPPGQFYSDQVGPMMNGRRDEYNIHPKPLLSMGTAVWRKNYDTIAERIVQDNRLGKLSNRELFLTMSGKEYTGKPLVEMGNLALAGKSTDPAERNLNVERESLRIQSEGLNL